MKKILMFTLSILMIFSFAIRSNADNTTNENNKVKNAIENLFSSIKQLDIDDVLDYVDEKNKNEIKNMFVPVDDFITQYPSAKDDIINILSKIEYEIKSIENSENDIKKVDMSYKVPDYEKVIEKCKIQIIAKNAIKYVANGFKIDNDILASSLDIISKELDKENDLAKITFDYSLSMKNVNGKYKLQNLSQIFRDIESQVVTKISSALK